MKKSINKKPVKHVPRRTCIACRLVEGKRTLVRLVRTPEGRVEVDLTGKKAGRGAYLCRTTSCWETGIKAGKLEHSLKVTLVPGDRDRLVISGQELMKENLGGQSR